VTMDAGDVIGADMRLVEALNLKVDEAMLTGESEPVEKS
jgi:magnesium-transporting ATPase (P-type)